MLEFCGLTTVGQKKVGYIDGNTIRDGEEARTNDDYDDNDNNNKTLRGVMHKCE